MAAKAPGAGEQRARSWETRNPVEDRRFVEGLRKSGLSIEAKH